LIRTNTDVIKGATAQNMFIKAKLSQGSATTLSKNSSSWLNLNDQAVSISIFLREELERRTSNVQPRFSVVE
jgi:hypothetical protein